MLRLTLLCHGATAATRGVAFPADEPLEARAIAAARDLRPGSPPSRVLTSPALRARQTAEAMGFSPDIEAGLRDHDHGRWSRQGLSSVMEREPDAFADFMGDPRAKPHGGESIADVAARTGAWLEATLTSRGPILAVTHAAVIRAALLTVLGAPLDAFWRIDIPPLSTTDLVSDGRRWVWRPARTRRQGDRS